MGKNKNASPDFNVHFPEHFREQIAPEIRNDPEKRSGKGFYESKFLFQYQQGEIFFSCNL